MASTPNFNWSTPDNTGLVKNGALDIRTLGNSIDASLVDLKGGTTGQLLSKASGTDMDFTWTSPNPGDITAVTAGTGISGGGTSGDVTITNSMATAIDAKGDLIAGTGADAFARLAVGANDASLVADSTTSTGLKWEGVWTAYTPTLYGFTLGNGTMTARYSKIGKTYNVMVKLSWGSTSAFTTGRIGFSMPAGSNHNPPIYGWYDKFGASSNNAMAGLMLGSSGIAYTDAMNASGTYVVGTYVTATIPFTWGANDSLQFAVVYEGV